MEVEGINAEVSSVTSSVLSDLPETSEEIARSYTTISDDASRALHQFGDQDEILGAAYDVFNSHIQLDGPTDEGGPSNSENIQKRAAPKDVQKSSKRVKKDIWDVDFVTQNPKSPLVTAPLKPILAHPDAFDSLTADQQSQIIAMMPDDKHIVYGSDGKPRISPDFLKYDPDWAYYLSRVQEDISEGRNDPAWISQAKKAFEQRQNGDFDNFKDEEYEVFWGVKQKVPHSVLAGQSSALNLYILFKEGVLLAGDTWILRRKFAGTDGAAATIMEKEMKIMEVSRKGLPTIHIPPGGFKMSNPARNDIIMENVSAPGKAENIAVVEFGILDPPHGNAWKSIRVMRDNQDLGSLWDIRQSFQFSQREKAFLSSLFGGKGLNYRASKALEEDGLGWVNPFMIAVQQSQMLTENIQPPGTMKVSNELQEALDKIAAPQCRIFRVDYRVMIHDGFPCPARQDNDEFGNNGERPYDKESLLKMADNGPSLFTTVFTRNLAGKNGPGWSLGHAHLGKNALGALSSSEHGSTKYFSGLMIKMADDVREATRAAIYLPKMLDASQKEQLELLFADNPRYRPVPCLKFLQEEFTPRTLLSTTSQLNHQKSCSSKPHAASRQLPQLAIDKNLNSLLTISSQRRYACNGEDSNGMHLPPTSSYESAPKPTPEYFSQYPHLEPSMASCSSAGPYFEPAMNAYFYVGPYFETHGGQTNAEYREYVFDEENGHSRNDTFDQPSLGSQELEQPVSVPSMAFDIANLDPALLL